MSAAPPGRRTLLGAALLAGVLPALGREREAATGEAAAERVFADEGASAGCFALRAAASGALTLVHAERARQRFAPASTFKIANTLIALQAGAVKDAQELIPYGGKPQPFPQWERDMKLGDAFAASAVPIYQELARRVGLARMRAAVAAFGYGNGEVGAVVDRFWLDGPLAISAVEQTEFLARLAMGRLPVAPRHLALLRDISRVDRQGGASLHVKSGWVFEARPQIGWWVGWVDGPAGLHSFALNIDMAGLQDTPRRERIGRRLLQHFGVFRSAAAA